MKAVVIATGARRPGRADASDLPPLASVIDRPLVQHLAEKLVGLGFTRLEFVLSRRPEVFESLLGDGRRWGAVVRHHLAPDPDRPYKRVKVIAADPHEPFLLVHADRLIHFSAQRHEIASGGWPLIWLAPSPHGPVWTGWAALTADALPDQVDALDTEAFERWIVAAAESGGRTALVRRMIDVRDDEGLWAAQFEPLEQNRLGLMLSGRRVDPGIWLSRNVSLHPTALLQPPVFIGPDSRIGPGVRIGPRAVVMAGSVVDHRASVVDSAVFPGSYIGRDLEVRRCLVDRNRVVHLDLGADLTVSDEFILGALETGRFKRWAGSMPWRMLAAALWAMLIPARLAARLGAPSGPTARPDARDGGPADQWRHLIERVGPNLLGVVRGRIDLVGLPDRSDDDVAALPPAWGDLCQKRPRGLIPPGRAWAPPNPHPDDLYTAESFYAATAGFKTDCQVLWKYAVGLFKGSIEADPDKPY